MGLFIIIEFFTQKIQQKNNYNPNNINRNQIKNQPPNF